MIVANALTQRIEPARSTSEGDGLRPIEQHPVPQVQPQRIGEHAPLDVAPLAHEILGRVGMADYLDVLWMIGPSSKSAVT